MSHSKIISLVQSLTQATEQGLINWERTAENGIYQIAFPEYSIQIGPVETSDPFEAHVLLKIIDDRGKLVERVIPSDLVPFLTDSDSYMWSLYDLARRSAMGVDKAVDLLLQRFAALGVHNEEEEDPSNTSSFPFNDTPEDDSSL